MTESARFPFELLGTCLHNWTGADQSKGFDLDRHFMQLDRENTS